MALRFAVLVPLLVGTSFAADPPAKPPVPVRKIVPGQVIVPTEKMRRIWGELVSLDLRTRSGTFRNESNDEVMPFNVLPYAELLHHAASGDLPDYRIGERAIFRLHENDEGKWVWLTYIQDEMNFLNGHKEFYWVDAVDPAAGRISFTQANADKSYVRDKGQTLVVDANTRFWKGGKPASLFDVKVGDKLRAKTHGVGKGKVRACWEVFLDEESLAKFQEEQKAAHRQAMARDGLPGYVDAADGKVVRLTLFQEGREQAKDLKVGQKVSVAPAGADRRPVVAPMAATVTEVKAVGNLTRVALATEADANGFVPPGLARLWIAK